MERLIPDTYPELTGGYSYPMPFPRSNITGPTGLLEWTSRGSWPRTLQVCTRPLAACHSLQYSCPTTTKYWCMWRIQYQWFVVARVWQLQNRRGERELLLPTSTSAGSFQIKSFYLLQCDARRAKVQKYNFFFWKNNRCTCVFVWCKLITMLLCWTIVLYDVNLLLNCGVLEYCVMSN